MAKSAKTSQEKTVLQAEMRTITGKKVNALRKQRMVPANVFGPNFDSKSITVTLKDFTAAYKVAHETGIVYVNVDKDSIPTLIKDIQKHPVTGFILHVDFRKIDLSQKIVTTVPVHFEGDSVAVNQLNGVLITQNDHLDIEALPEKIPAHIEVDISALKEIGDEITVKDIKANSDYVIITDPETVVVSVTAHKEESVVPETTTTAPEVITEKASEEGGEESATPAEEEKSE
jgi:large subunit ribosomal protein L25